MTHNGSLRPRRRGADGWLAPLSVVFLAILAAAILGCTPAGVSHERPAIDPSVQAVSWERRVEAPETLRNALAAGRVEMLPVEGRAPIPVRVFGEGGRRTPVVLSHGLQSHSGWFAQSARHVSGLGHPVYAMDRRGSGLSRGPRGDMKSFREMLADIEVVAETAARRHGATSVYLLGHCFGAIPAAAFACDYPERVKGLLLSTPAFYTRTSIPFLQAVKIFLTPSGRRDFHVPAPLETEWFSELEAFEGFIRSDDLALKSATGDFYYEVHRARKFLFRNADRITMPVFMAVAGEDPICDNRKNLDFFESLPADDKIVVHYEDARHILEFSPERDRFLGDLSWWLDREGG